MPFSFTVPRPPNPFSHMQRNKKESGSKSTGHDTSLRYYPLSRGTQSGAANTTNTIYGQRTPPYTQNAPAQTAPAQTPYPQPQQQRQPQPQPQQQQPRQAQPQPRQPWQTQQRQPPQPPASQMPPSQPMSYAAPAYPPQPQSQQRQMPSQMPQASQSYQPQPSPRSQPQPQPQFQPSADPAARLRNINQSLPDGVRYEPLDDKTLQILRASGKLPSGAPSGSQPVTPPSSPHSPAMAPPPAPQTPSMGAPPSAFSAPSEGGKPEHAEILMHMMQDERNAHIFYNHLSRVAPREEYSAVLAEISMQCRQRVDTYAILLNKLCSSEFSPQETAVNTLVAFDEGITLAIAEENKSLRALTEWLDTLEDAAVARTVQNIINRKMLSHHQLMHLG